SIIGQTQLLLKRTDSPDQQQALETIGAQAWRIRDMIGDTMLFARPPQPEFEDCDLAAIARDVVDKVNSKRSRGRVRVSWSCPSGVVRTFADHTQLRILVTNLLDNAVEAVSDVETDPVVTVSLRTAAPFAVELVVADNAPAMSPEVRRHLFNPFFSGRQAGRGLGFGLSHCWQIVRMHNGILMHELQDPGSRFLVILPTR
ncbi:MAG: HAMP domain-containing histidine kinase, partial [Planctomycetaceae bacterium]|nr:HAMP domain-containing histidine kinase [Planctomycetaceae bacterium]